MSLTEEEMVAYLRDREEPVPVTEDEEDEREASGFFKVSKADIIGDTSTEAQEDLSDLTGAPESVGLAADDMADLMEVELEDIEGEDDKDYMEDLVETEGEVPDDMSDLVDVSDEDVMGTAPQPKPEVRLTPRGSSAVRRPPPRRFPPPPTMGGIR